MQFDHINIGASGEMLDIIRDFYCEVFGMSVGPRPSFSYHGYWLYMGEQAFVHLVEKDDRIRPDGTPHLDHVAFRLSGLARFVTRLENYGANYTIKFREDKNTTRIFVRDPVGSHIELNFVDERLGSTHETRE